MNSFQNIAEASYLLYIERYADIQFAVGKIVR